MEDLTDILWKIHHKAFEENDEIVLGLVDVALALAQNRSKDQVLMILSSHRLTEYYNDYLEEEE
jgi:hypothetical protein